MASVARARVSEPPLPSAYCPLPAAYPALL